MRGNDPSVRAFLARRLVYVGVGCLHRFIASSLHRFIGARFIWVSGSMSGRLGEPRPDTSASTAGPDFMRINSPPHHDLANIRIARSRGVSPLNSRRPCLAHTRPRPDISAQTHPLPASTSEAQNRPPHLRFSTTAPDAKILAPIHGPFPTQQTHDHHLPQPSLL
jgi:hypothetical protein